MGTAPYFVPDCDVYPAVYSTSSSPDDNVDIGHSVINPTVVVDSNIIT